MLPTFTNLFEIKIKGHNKFSVLKKKLVVISREEFIDKLGLKLSKIVEEIEDIGKYTIVEIEKAFLKIEYPKRTDKIYSFKTKPPREELDRILQKFLSSLRKKKILYLGVENIAKTKVKNLGSSIIYDIENSKRIYKLPNKNYSVIHLNFANLKTLNEFRLNPSSYAETLVNVFREINNQNFAEYSAETIAHKLLKNPHNKFYFLPSNGTIKDRVLYINYHILFQIQVNHLF